MNAWFMSNFTLSVMFLIFALIFTLLGEKGANLISGFNTMSKEEKNHYDKKGIVSDMRNDFLIWAAILAIGAICTYLFNWLFAPIALIIWLVVLFSDVHLDPYLAFDKYKKD